MADVPAIPGGFLLGAALEYRKDIPAFFVRVVDECGPIGSFRLGPLTMIQVNDPELVKELFDPHRARDRPR